jgi:DNA-binding NtrC family response regulator
VITARASSCKDNGEGVCMSCSTVHAMPSYELAVPAFVAAELVTLAELERRYVRVVLDACGGNKSAAARALGISRRALYRRLEVTS